MNPEHLELAAGFFDILELRGSELHVFGWMLLPNGPLDKIEIFWNGEILGPATPVLREDVKRFSPWIAHAAGSGFQARFPLPGQGCGRLDVIGYHLGRPSARLSLRLFGLAEMDRGLPPPDLTLRVSGLEGEPFRLRALKAFTDVLDQVERHREPGGAGRVLDWGCGCGALSDLFLRHTDFREVHGCDIDRQAIEWCQSRLPEGRFTCTAPHPPLPYADGSFDLVVGSSVFTHLARPDQRAWLAEIRRVLKPGGLLLASVHGPHAFRHAFRQRASGVLHAARLVQRRWQTRLSLWLRGISAAQRDRGLDGIAPEGYYRAVYQTPRYTKRNWSRYLEVVDYVERGLAGYQDLVVLRRRPG